MSKQEWGIKRICPKCNVKYYDFNKTPIICPCPESFEFDPDLLLKSKKGRGIVNNSGEIETSISNDVNQQKNDEEVLNEDILDIDDEDEVEDNLNSGIKNDIEENLDTELATKLDDEINEDIDVESDDITFIENEIDESDDQMTIEINDEEDQEKNN